MLRQQLPKYGCFPRWPENGQGFIHPEDVELASRCMPSERVFRRFDFDGTYYHYDYGDLRFRLLPCMWLPVKSDGIDIGDQVETIGVGMRRDLFVAEVSGMYFVRRKGCTVYRLRRSRSLLPNLYTASEMRLLTEKTRIRQGDVTHRRLNS